MLLFAESLDFRWKMSATTTFADHGVTPEQRMLGLGLSVLFDTVKLYESERRLTGQPARRPVQRDRDLQMSSVAFGMAPYSFKAGDLDRNMLARL